jgi:hypothetical protein
LPIVQDELKNEQVCASSGVPADALDEHPGPSACTRPAAAGLRFSLSTVDGLHWLVDYAWRRRLMEISLADDMK